jgi:hypothetical protein
MADAADDAPDAADTTPDITPAAAAALAIAPAATPDAAPADASTNAPAVDEGARAAAWAGAALGMLRANRARGGETAAGQYLGRTGGAAPAYGRDGRLVVGQVDELARQVDRACGVAGGGTGGGAWAGGGDDPVEVGVRDVAAAIVGGMPGYDPAPAVRRAAAALRRYERTACESDPSGRPCLSARGTAVSLPARAADLEQALADGDLDDEAGAATLAAALDAVAAALAPPAGLGAAAPRAGDGAPPGGQPGYGPGNGPGNGIPIVFAAVDDDAAVGRLEAAALPVAAGLAAARRRLAASADAAGRAARGALAALRTTR